MNIRKVLREVDDSMWFSVLINVPFWCSVFYGIYQLFYNYKITAAIAICWFFIILLYWLIFSLFVFGEKNPISGFRNFINIIDDPIDTIKEMLHCMPLPFGYQLNISFLMSNRKTTWDIIRKQGYYENCDPEDME